MLMSNFEVAVELYKQGICLSVKSVTVICTVPAPLL